MMALLWAWLTGLVLVVLFFWRAGRQRRSRTHETIVRGHKWRDRND